CKGAVTAPSHRLDAEPRPSVRLPLAVLTQHGGAAGEPVRVQQLEAPIAAALGGEGAAAVPSRTARGAAPRTGPRRPELLLADLARDLAGDELPCASARWRERLPARPVEDSHDQQVVAGPRRVAVQVVAGRPVAVPHMGGVDLHVAAVLEGGPDQRRHRLVAATSGREDVA